MPKFFSLEQPPKEEVKKLIKELHKYSPELKPRSAFVFPLNENRKDALEMIETDEFNEEKVMKFLESDDFIEKQAGLYFFSKIPKLSEENYAKALAIIEQMGGNKGGDIQEAMTQARVKIIIETKGKEDLSILEQMSKDKNRDVQEAAIQALGNLGEKALLILEQKQISKDEDEDIREAAAQAKVKIIIETKGKQALPALEQMSRDLGGGRHVQRAAAQARVKIIIETEGKKALPILKQMNKDKNWYIQEAAAQALKKAKGAKEHKWLLATRKPLFATPHTKELAERILKIQEIVKNLKEKYKDDFVGLTIFGSTAKGYFTKRLFHQSDLDWGIIARKKEVSEEFKKMAKSLYLCFEHYVGMNEKYQIQQNEGMLFYGLFFGDYTKLLEIQKEFLENTSKEKWDEIRKDILENETHLYKAEERFGLTKEEMEKIIQTTALLRVPPSYEETLKIVGKR